MKSDSQVTNQEKSSVVLNDQKKTFKISVASKIIFLLILEACLLFVSGFYGYKKGQGSNLNSNIENNVNISPSTTLSPTITPTPSGKIYPLNIPTPTETSYDQDTRINLSSIEELKGGYPSSNENPEFEVFLFADLTEEGFSGRMLTENVNYLLEQYPQMRVWYLHTVLPYRDNPNLRSAIAVLKCLSDQKAVWQNMSNLVKEKGQPNFIYQLEDQEEYIRCITEINKDSQYFDSSVKHGQELMQKYGIVGIPTTLFVSTKNPSYGTRIPGALPKEAFEKEIKKVISE